MPSSHAEAVEKGSPRTSLRDKTEKALGYAQQFVRSGHLDRARKEILLNLVRPLSDEDHGRTLAHLARLDFRQGYLDAAHDNAKKALELIPDAFHRRDAERSIANNVLWELEWQRKHPEPSAWQLRLRKLMRKVFGDLVYHP